MPDGVIFDMDGVLVNSGPPHRESWRVVARQHGIVVSDQAFAATFGMASRDIVRQIWGPHVTDEDIRRIDDEKEAVYRRLIADCVPLTPGAHPTLEALGQAGYVLAVGTSGPPANLELVLRATGLGQYFAATVHGFDIEHGKPAPDVFLLAAERAGLQPARCVVVEDAPVGVQAGTAAGMPVIGYTGTHPAERLQAAGATQTVARLTEITPELVAGMLRPAARD